MTSTRKPRKMLWILVLLGIVGIGFLATQYGINPRQTNNDKDVANKAVYTSPPVVTDSGKEIKACFDESINEGAPGYIDFSDLHSPAREDFKAWVKKRGLRLESSDGRIPGLLGLPAHYKVCGRRPPKSSHAHSLANPKTLRENHSFSYDQEDYGYARYGVYMNKEEVVFIVGYYR